MSLVFARGLLKEVKNLQKELSGFGNRFALITDHIVSSHYAEKLYVELQSLGLDVSLFSFPAGEESKTRVAKESLENQLLEKGFGRDSCFIAIGGGVVTDLVGFLAATYCRGVPLVLIPTSLLGMVDAAIGGKNGINTPYGKNLIGSIYMPEKIYIDPEVLGTLPKEELSNGAIEILKHGLIASASLFDYLENRTEEFFALGPLLIDQVLKESYQIKTDIVVQDPQEKGKRHLLNFGHTIGHAIEKLSCYSISHGLAVAVGILVESYLSVVLGFLSMQSWQRIFEVIRAYAPIKGLSLSFSLEDLLDAMVLDKKSLKGRPRFVLLEEIGKAKASDLAYCYPVEEALIEKAWKKVLNALRCN